jgi:hypothetical protein
MVLALQEHPRAHLAVSLGLGRFHLHFHARPVQLGVGLVGLLLLLGGELGLALELGGQSPGEYIASRGPVSGTAYALSLPLLVLMPALVTRDPKPQ